MRNAPLLLLAIAIVGCGVWPTPTPAATLTPPWADGERLEFNIERGGKTEGTIVFTTTRKDDGYLFAAETKLGPMVDISQVRVDKDLRPIATTRQLSGAGRADFTLLAVYDKGKLSVQAKTADGDKAVTVNVAADAWDNDQLLMTVRALPLAENRMFPVTNVVAASATSVKAEIRVVGQEKLDVPAGSYATYKVELHFGSGAHYAWYDVNKPHYLVKYENTDVQRVFLLTKVGTP